MSVISTLRKIVVKKFTIIKRNESYKPVSLQIIYKDYSSMKKIIVSAIALVAALPGAATNDNTPLYKDKNAPIEQRIDDLLSRMTLDEKVMQLNQYTYGLNTNVNNIGEEVTNIPAEIGSLSYFGSDPVERNDMQRKAMEESRLGIPILFGIDVIHGFRTIYPISLAQACSWNPQLVEAACHVAARETRSSGVDWTYSPMIDVARDPRWGRVSEGYGEDPYTNGVFAEASVRGYQGDDLTSPNNIAACLKHYVGYGASEAGRDYVYTEVSPQTLWDTYLLPYEMGIKAGAQTVMSSFNDISGVPGSANYYTLTEILKNRWKHDGFVVSDWRSIEQLIYQGLAADIKEAGLKAFNSGLEMDLLSHAYDLHLAELVREGKVSEQQINEAVRRVLRVKMRLGLFENPYTPILPEAKRYLLPEYRSIARNLATESMVLMKNKDNILPLIGKKRIAVVGPMAKNKYDLLGSWRAQGQADDGESIYNALARKFGKDVDITFAWGCEFDGDDDSGINAAVAAAKKADVTILCLGEKSEWSGENAVRSTIALPEIQEKLTKAIYTTGTPIVLLLSNGRPIDLSRIEPMSNAILEVWQPGVEGAMAIADILAGDTNPSGKLAITFPYSTGQIPIYYNRRKPARWDQGFYQDITSDPLYPFGHGLSYTTFEYGDIIPSDTIVTRDGKLKLEITVTNIGKIDGKETVHWFVSDPYCSITRPVKELKYFEKIEIPAGEKRTFSFNVDLMRDFGFVDSDGKRFLETGDYYVSVVDKKVKIQLVD